MITNKPTVTIGIPAYKEANNLKVLLPVLLDQNHHFYHLEKIIVVCDGCDQDTTNVIKKLRSKKISLLINTRRSGQQYSQNRIVKNCHSDILIFLEADTLPYNNHIIDYLVHPFTDKNSQFDMVVGVPLPSKPDNYFEKILNQGHSIKQEIFSHWKNGINVYTAGGHSMKALSRRFYQKLQWPISAPEDAYVYFSLRRLGLKMFRSTQAKSLMKNVSNLTDRYKQCSKFQAGKKALKKYFDVSYLDNEYRLSFFLILKVVIYNLFKHPVLTGLYLAEVGINRIITDNKTKFNPLYEPYLSSKRLTYETKH